MTFNWEKQMAKYKGYSYDQGVFLPVYFDKQILPGTFEFSLNHLKEWSGTKKDFQRKAIKL